MLKIRSIYYLIPIRRTMDEEERANFEGQMVDLINCLQEKDKELDKLKDKPILGAIDSIRRIAEALEGILRYTEVNL